MCPGALIQNFKKSVEWFSGCIGLENLLPKLYPVFLSDARFLLGVQSGKSKHLFRQYRQSGRLGQPSRWLCDEYTVNHESTVSSTLAKYFTDTSAAPYHPQDSCIIFDSDHHALTAWTPLLAAD
jgi:hypothetical protein